MKSDIEIRNAVIEDLLQIFQLEEALFKPMHYPIFALRQFYDIFPNLFFVAVDEHNLIKGYCFGGINYETRMGWILTLAVQKSEQKKKIGQRLTTELLTAFKNKNIKTIQLTTTPDNGPAIGLYEKLGFKKATENSDYYLDSSERILMKLETQV